MKDPLYGDPAHPNHLGMWNPEFAYFGPPVGAPPRGSNTAIPPGGVPAAVHLPVRMHRALPCCDTPVHAAGAATTDTCIREALRGVEQKFETARRNPTP